jgi:ABC-type Fe3+-hydroxamate transport system substrate-binding protein
MPEVLGFQLVLLNGIPPTNSAYSDHLISIEAFVQLEPDIVIVTAWDKSNLYDPESAAKRQWEETPLLQRCKPFKRDVSVL